MAVEELEAAALGKIPGLKALLTCNEAQVTPNLPVLTILTSQNSDRSGTSSHSKIWDSEMLRLYCGSPVPKRSNIAHFFLARCLKNLPTKITFVMDTYYIVCTMGSRKEHTRAGAPLRRQKWRYVIEACSPDHIVKVCTHLIREVMLYPRV